MKVIVRAHRRKGKPVRQHPREIGTSWKGKKYTHGPRKHLPSRYSEFRLGKKTKTGKRVLFGKVKGTNKWEVQSTLKPNFGSTSRILHWPTKTNIGIDFEYPAQAQSYIDKRLGGSKAFNIYQKKNVNN